MAPGKRVGKARSIEAKLCKSVLANSSDTHVGLDLARRNRSTVQFIRPSWRQERIMKRCLSTGPRTAWHLLVVPLTALACAACPQPPSAAPTSWQAPNPGQGSPQGSPPSAGGGAPGGSPEAHPAGPVGELERRYAGAAVLEVLTGKATYYGDSLAGNKTASGEVYDPLQFTAAHRKLPFGTVVRVIRLGTPHVTYVRITDRGPFAGRQRIIDLSKIAARKIDMIRAGVVDVRVEVVQWPAAGKSR